MISPQYVDGLELRIKELSSKLESVTAGFAIEHEKFLKANERATAAESRLDRCLDLLREVVDHEIGLPDEVINRIGKEFGK